MNKKGQALEKIGLLASAVLIFALILVVSFLFMSNTKEATVNSAALSTYTNLSKTIPNASTTTFTECVSIVDMNIGTVYNGTVSATSIALGSANYTVSNNQITMSVTGVSYSPTTKATFSCKPLDFNYNSTSELQTQTFNITSFVGVMIIVIIGTIMLALVIQLRKTY